MPVDRSQPVYPPSKGEDILAQWGDDVSEHVVQRFASTGDRDAKWANPPKGALCVTVDTLTLWKYDGTNWVSVLPPKPLFAMAQDPSLHDTGGPNWLGHPRLLVRWTAKANTTYEIGHSGLYYVDRATQHPLDTVGVRVMNYIVVGGANNPIDPSIRGNFLLPGHSNAASGTIVGLCGGFPDGASMITEIQIAEAVSNMGTIHCYGHAAFPMRLWVREC